MATAELKVRIEAEIADFKKGLNKANGDLNNFSGRVTESLRKTSAEAAKTSALLGGSITKSSNQAAFALNNLGRVAQDAPFGFIGIQNNLNPLLESFQSLKKESGSTGSALKALAGSLIGPAGLGLALSLVSSGILFYQEYLRKSSKTTQDAKKSTEEYANSLGQVQRAQLTGAQSATQEVTQLSLLFKQYQNNALTLGQRKSAYDELQRLYPAYFGNIAFEQQASSKTKDAYDRLTSSIIATGRARAAADLITKNSQRQLENEQKLIDLGIELTNQQNIARKALQATRAAGGELGEAKALADFTNAQKEQRAIQQQINNLVTDSVILRNKNLQLEKSVTAEIQKGAVLSGNIGGDPIEKIKKDKSKIKQVGKSVGVTLSSGISEGFATTLPVVGLDLSTKLKTGLNDWQTYVNSELLPKVQGNFETFFNDILMRGKLSFESLGKAILNTFLSIIASDAARGLTNLLSVNTGRQYSDSLGKGKGGGLLGGLIGLLGKGKTAGAAATGTAATSGALLPIIGGIAAVAGIASLFKKRKTEPTPAFTTSNAIASQPTSVGFDTGRVVFEISGVNLVGVLNRAGAKLQRFGP